MANKDYLVTVRCVCYKKYYVNAADWEYAEDYALDEVHGDTFHVDEFDFEAYEVEQV